MTREDAIQFLTDTGISPEHIMELVEALSSSEKPNKWIDADVLDKIRAEIEEYRDTMPWESKSLVKWEAINYILEQIIDPYKASPTGEEVE